MNFRGNMRGNNGSMPNRGGPLMTDHLQDLELELELLKRKRQLIQRQQSSMLYNNGSGGNMDMGGMNYNQPSQLFNDRFNEPQHLNFSHLYNEAPRDDRSFGVKRRAQPEWPSAPAGPSPMGGPKRPRQGPSARQNFQNKPQTFQRPRPNQPPPLLNAPVPKPLMNFSAQPRRGPPPLMRQTQGPKPLTHHPNFKQNKPAPKPFPHKKPNTSPKKTTPSKPPTPKSVEKQQARTFMPNKQNDNKLNGRLELALGMILKEIKVTYGSKPGYKNLFTHMPLARLMKQGIRERLHAVMTGKVVLTANDILADYRLKFPLDTDKDIVELAVLEQQKNAEKGELAIKLLEEGDPEQYFKKNMRKLLQSRFGEMMHKLEQVVREENKAFTTTQILAHLPDLNKLPEEIMKKPRQPPVAVGAPQKATEEPVKVDQDTDFTEDVNIVEEPAKVDEAAKQVVGVKDDGQPAKVDGEAAKVDGDAAKVENTVKDDEDVVIPVDCDGPSKQRDYDKWISLYLQRRLPALLPHFRHTILKIFDLDNMYRNTKAAITINANNKASAGFSKPLTEEQSKDDPELPRNLPYFAKVLAVPAMPKRWQMQQFLNTFSPKTIKRHKKNYNLLFVGFDSKENYEKILAANQHTVGNATVSIVGNVAKTTTIEIEDQTDNDIDQVLTPQLDDQINDLLSSIRKADEESKDEEKADIDLTTDDVEDKDANDNEPQKTDEPEANGNGTAEENQGNGTVKDDDCEVVEGGDHVVTIEDDEVAPLKSNEAKQPATPAKGRAPATPSSVRTRRSSRLQN